MRYNLHFAVRPPEGQGFRAILIVLILVGAIVSPCPGLLVYQIGKRYGVEYPHEFLIKSTRHGQRGGLLNLGEGKLRSGRVRERIRQP